VLDERKWNGRNFVLQNAGSVLRYYTGGYINALLQIYHDIGLDPKKFSLPSIFSHPIFPFLLFSFSPSLIILLGEYWNEKENRKAFFDEFAKKHSFNSLLPHNWYTVSPKLIKSAKVC
jgi:hypothetical protein